MSLIEPLEGRQHFYFGQITAGFGTAGVGTAPTVGGSDNGFIEALTLSDGKTLVGAGGGLTRFNTNGALDTTFGTSGITVFKGFSYRDHAVDSSGRTYVLAYSGSGTILLRYGTNGRLDTGFGTNGTSLVESSKRFAPDSIAIQSDGKVVVAGTVTVDDKGRLTRVYRLSSAGGLDTNFGSSGYAQFTMAAVDLITPEANDQIADLKVLSSGKIQLLGSSYNYLSGGYDENTGEYTDAVTGNSVSALVRLNSNGTLDSSFGTSGIARRATFDDNSVNASAGVIKSDGSAVIATNGGTNDGRTLYLGLSSSGKTVFNPYTADIAGAGAPTAAAALTDGRVAFVGPNGGTYTVSTAGALSNTVTPLAANNGSEAVVTTSTGDLNIVAADSGTLAMKIVNIDSGKATEPRPDNFPAAGAVDTAADTFGGLHVAYFDVASKSLKYAYRNPQGYWGGILTVDATAGAGAAISIDTIELKGRTNVGIAYYDSSSADLRLATSRTNGRVFSLQTVASKGAVGISPSFLFTDSGGFAVTYYSKTTKSLYYALNTGSGWSADLVDSGGSGEWNELVFDPTSRKPAIAYTGPDNTVWYAFRGTGTSWKDARVKVATTTAGAAFVNVAVPDYIYYGPKVSYYDLATADLVLASYDRYADAGKRWSTEVIASRGAVGAWNDLVDANYGDYTLYAYNRNGDSAFKYQSGYYWGDAMTTTNIATGGGKYLSVAVDDSGITKAISYVDTASGQLFVR